MKETIFDISQEDAIRYGLSLKEVILLDFIFQRVNCKKAHRLHIDGNEYVWILYGNIEEWLPILGLNKRGIAKHIDRLVAVGLVDKRVIKIGGIFTYFRITQKGQRLFQKEQRVCSESDKGYVPKVTNKKNTVEEDTVEKEKEKDISKDISKKKVADFDTELQKFKEKAAEDIDLERNLKAYKIINLTALIDSFGKHVTNLCRAREFTNNGYIRNRQWLLNAISHLDLTAATGHKIGVGESLRDGKRYYFIHGEQREVPIDAPPRQLKDQVWYAREKRWGPDV